MQFNRLRGGFNSVHVADYQENLTVCAAIGFVPDGIGQVTSTMGLSTRNAKLPDTTAMQPIRALLPLKALPSAAIDLWIASPMIYSPQR
jgi:hypothetical protein